MAAIYHVCSNKDWFYNFEKLDGCSIVMGDDRPCNMEGIGIIPIKMFDGIVRELKNVGMYLSCKNFLSQLVLWKHWV